MRLGRKTLSAAAVAGVVTAGFLAATPASADVARTTCSSAAVAIQHPGWADQCFLWNGYAPNVLDVRDWYSAVQSGQYNIKVQWHDQSTNATYYRYLGSHSASYQPTSNCILVSVTFD